MKLFLFIISFLFTSSVFANNPGVSYQGRIFKPDGYPLEGSNVQFRMQVRSPGAENCLLFEEIQTVNMTGSSGIFSITLNDGTGTRLDTPTYQVDRIFANRDVMTLDATRCAAGTTYTPNTADGRKFVVYFKDETMAAYEPLPVMNLNYAPQAMYALEAQKVGTFAVNNILRAVDVSGNPVTAPALNPTQLTNLNNLLAGTSSQYATAADFGTVQTFAKAALPTCGAGEVLKANGTAFSCVTDSAGGAPAYSAITAATAANSIDNTNYAQTWNWSTATTQSPMSLSANALTTGSGLNLTTSSASLNSTNGFLNVANTGASTSGILARMQSNSTAGSGLTVLTNGNVGIGTSSPGVPFDVLSVVNDTVARISNGSGGANAIAGMSFGNDLADTGIVGITSSGTASYSRRLLLSANNIGISLNTSGTGDIRMKTNTGEALRINSLGNVGIGTTSPTSTLHIVGANGTTGAAPTAFTLVGGTGGTNGKGGGISLTSGAGSGSGGGGDVAIAGGSGVGNPFYSPRGNVKINGGDNGGDTNGVVTIRGGNYGTSTGAQLVLSGGTSTVTGSATFSTGNAGGLVGNTGSISIITGNATMGSNAGGLSLSAGAGSLAGTGGAINITAGAGGATNINGSNVTINPGAKGGTGADGNVILANLRGNVGIGTTTPQAALHVNGDVVLAKRSSEPVVCSITYDGMIALTSQYTTCVCKGGTPSWVRTSDGVTACVW